jgi:hypothetical protein
MSAGQLRHETLLTPEDVSEILRVPVALLYKWRYSRIGPPSFKVGRYVRYRPSDLAVWIDEQARLPG